MTLTKFQKAGFRQHRHSQNQIGGQAEEILEGLVANRASGFQTEWITLDGRQAVVLYYRKLTITAFDPDGETASSSGTDNGATIHWFLEHQESEDGETWNGGSISAAFGDSESYPSVIRNVGAALRFHRWRMRLMFIEDLNPVVDESEFEGRLYDGANDPSVTFDLHVAVL